MSRTLVVLGGSSDQLFLIRTAQEMGLRVLAFDRDPRCPAASVADEFAALSTRDLRALAGFLDERRGEVAGVATMGSDIPELVAALAAHVGAPHLAPETARLATDKLAMKERFRASDVPTPWFAEVRSARELERLARERGGELVLKPVDRSGSRGVFLLDASADLAPYFERARELSFSGRVMVEEYLAGPQISTETLLWRGRAATPGFADRNYELLDRFRPRIMENGGWVPSALGAAERAAVEAVVTRAARALGIESGVAKGDVVLAPEGPRVIEIAARLSGGDFCESLVPLGTGLNYVRAAIRIAIGEEPDLDALVPTFERAVANRYFFPQPGRVERIEGEDEVRARDWVHKLELWYGPGERVPEPSSHAQRFGVFVVSAPERETAQERVDWVYDTLRIVTS